jgi:hypothetical protein
MKLFGEQCRIKDFLRYSTNFLSPFAFKDLRNESALQCTTYHCISQVASASLRYEQREECSAELELLVPLPDEKDH